MKTITNEVEAADQLHQTFSDLKNEIGKVIVGQDDVIKLVLIALFCQGHSLLVGGSRAGKNIIDKYHCNCFGFEI